MSDDERELDQEGESVPPLLPDDNDNDSSDGNKGSSLWYTYKNYANLEEDRDFVERMPTALTAARGTGESSIRVQKFPVKLYVILAQKEFRDIITWLPHGRSWKVLKPSMFESLVMPLFFEYSNYHSFNRLVNAWSFRRVSSGPDRGSYYHELFLRGRPHLQKYMRRLPKTHKKLPMKKGDEPDFYRMDKENPLPSIEDAPIPSLTGNSGSEGGGGGGGGAQKLPLGAGPGEQRVVTPPRPMMPGASLGMRPPGPPHGHGGLGGMPPHASRYGAPPHGLYPPVAGGGSGGPPPSDLYDEYDMPPRHMQLPAQGYGRSPLSPIAAAYPDARRAQQQQQQLLRHSQGGGAGSPPPHMRTPTRHVPTRSQQPPPPPPPPPPHGMQDTHHRQQQMTPPPPRSRPHYADQHPHPSPAAGAGAGGAQPSPSDQQYMRFQQQQQMNHMQQLHQMRMLEHQQPGLTAQDEYAMRAMASSQRY